MWELFLNEKIYVKVIVSIVILLFSSQIFCQDDDYALMHHKILEAAQAYRDFAEAGSESGPIDLKNLEERWSKVEPNEEMVSYVRWNLAYLIATTSGQNVMSLKPLIKQFAPETKIRKELSRRDVKVIRSNLDFLLPLNSGFLEYRYPYEPLVDSFRVNAYNFINIQKDEVVADLGSGTGDHILLMTMVYPDNDFILNEIQRGLIKRMSKRLKADNNPFVNKRRSIEIKKGKKKDPSLGRKVDVIIIRNSFHHFAKKEEMLNSFNKYLNPNGRIILLEGLITDKEYLGSCDERLGYSDIMTSIVKSSWEVTKELRTKDTLMLEFKAL